MYGVGRGAWGVGRGAWGVGRGEYDKKIARLKISSAPPPPPPPPPPLPAVNIINATFAIKQTVSQLRERINADYE